MTGVDVGALTYSSFDRGDGVGGGWQVKQSVGLDPAQQELLRSRVQTHLDLATALPAFPTPADVAALPRKLVYAPLDGAFAYWHTVPAGVDGSGRPGNVFAHALLDARPAVRRRTLRPVELWRSPDWLTPYGPEQVLAAELPAAALPSRGSAAGRGAVLDFLLDPEYWRIGVLSVLLDAVDAVLTQDVRLVLGTRSTDEAALWIGAVSHLMSPGTSGSLAFSTYERANTLAASWDRGVQVACVPLVDLPSITAGSSVLVLDVTEDPALGDHGGEPHRTGAGSEVVVTPWSLIAAVALQDRQTADGALTGAARAADAVDSAELHRAWPLAMAVALAPGELVDAVSEAALVLGRDSPEELKADPELFAAASALLREGSGTGTGAAWQPLAAVRCVGGELTVGQDLQLRVYLERALLDAAWLAASPAPLPAGYAPRKPPAAALLEVTRTAVGRLRDRAAAWPEGVDDGGAFAVETLAALDLLGRAGLLAASTPDVLDEAREVVERVAVPLLLDPGQAAAVPAKVGRMGEEVLATVIRPCVATAPQLAGGVLGSRVPHVTLDWLFPTPPAPTEVQRLIDVPTPGDELLAEVGARICLHQRANSYGAQLRPYVLWWLLRNGDARPQPDPSPLFARPWPCEDLARFVSAFGNRIPARMLTGSLLADPGSTALDYLVGVLQSGVLQSPSVGRGEPHLDDAGYAAAALRQLCAGNWSSGADARRVIDDASHLLGCASAALTATSPRAVHPVVVEQVMIAMCFDAVSRPRGTDGDRLLPMLTASVGMGMGERVVPVVTAAVRAGVVTGFELVAAAMAGAADAPRSSLSRGRLGKLGTLRFRAGDYELSVLEYAASSWYLGADSASQSDVTAAALEHIWSQIENDPDAGQVNDELDRFAKRWWQAIGVHSGVRSRLRGR